MAALIAHQKIELGVVPPKLVYDRVAGLPKIFADVARASDGETQLVARLINHAKRSDRFGPLDFTLNQDGSLTCPNGKSTATFYRSNSADGWTYRGEFHAKSASLRCKRKPLQECISRRRPTSQRASRIPIGYRSTLREVLAGLPPH
mgnify:CR=1 FL=1